MTYNVFGGMLNLAQSISDVFLLSFCFTWRLSVCLSVCYTASHKNTDWISMKLLPEMCVCGQGKNY